MNVLHEPSKSFCLFFCWCLSLQITTHYLKYYENEQSRDENKPLAAVDLLLCEVEYNTDKTSHYVEVKLPEVR